MKLVKLRFFYFICMLFSLAGWAQDITVSGTVTDESGLPVPGASVTVKNGAASAATDIDGNYSIQVASDGTLTFSFIGYATQEVAVNNQTTINVSLIPATNELDEVVVVGYGTQKKKVVTGAISSVKAEDLDNKPLTTIGQSLQGRASGVLVAQNAGQPGSSATIRVRGITSFNNNDPLWVVDGVIVDNGGINFLNQSDIESIEILKDAASQAIYGARAAAGVILITTKKGKAGKLTVSYNGFAGVSEPARKLDLLNATQYATLRNEAYQNGFGGGGNSGFNLPFPNPQSYGQGTDWQDIIFNKSANRSQHEISVSGGNDKSTFYMSFGLTDQEGIVATDISNYIRRNIRINSTHKINDYITIGQNLGYSNEKTVGLGNTNSEYGGPLSSAINLDPITPAIVTDPSTQPNASDYAQPYALRNSQGQYYGISPYVANEMSNPLAYIQNRRGGNYGWADNFVGNAFIEITPIKGLRFRSTVGGKLAYWGSQSFSPLSYLNPNQNNQNQNSLYREMNQGFGWNIENSITYSKLIGGHNFSVLVAQAAYEDDISKGQGVTYFDLPVNNPEDASFNFNIPADNIQGWASTGNPHVVSSLFARATYDYKEKYLFTGIIRRDGSSRFGSNNKYGVFPSFSAGWVFTKEDFWTQNDYLNFFKLRAGYGVVGSDNIGNFRYLSLVSGGRNYTIGGPGNQYSVTTGYSPDAPSNPDLKWEETAQSNIGFEATVYNDFTLEFDYYKKKTTGILQDIRLPGYVGANGSPQGNVGDMQNTGIEVTLSYNKQIGNVGLRVSGNATTIKNEVTYIGQDRDFNQGPGFQSMGNIARYEVGSSINEFYGYVTDGVFQNQAEIDAAALPNDITVVPGDFRWKDLNGDGEITEDDRTYLGSWLPTVTYGITVNLDYKGFDLYILGQGAGGNKIFQGLRRLDLGNANWQTAALNRWTGEGTSNSYPRLSTSDPNQNFTRMSNFYLQDGDYFRLKILQLGYSLPTNLVGKAGLDRLRLYVTGENLFTLTKYTGFDPEIGGSVGGIDRGFYPQARSYMLGCNISF